MTVVTAQAGGRQKLFLMAIFWLFSLTTVLSLLFYYVETEEIKPALHHQQIEQRKLPQAQCLIGKMTCPSLLYQGNAEGITWRSGGIMTTNNLQNSFPSHTMHTQIPDILFCMLLTAKPSKTI